MDRWFQIEIAQGIRSLLVLGLDRTPATDILTEVIRTWCEDLWSSGWDEGEDAWRIAAAFRMLRQNSRIWPQMVDFRECLPPRRQPPQIEPPPLTEEERERSKAARQRFIVEMDRILGIMRA